MTREKHPVTYWPDGERREIDVTSEWAEARAEAIPQIRAMRARNGNAFTAIQASIRRRKLDKSIAAFSAALSVPGVETVVPEPIEEAIIQENTDHQSESSATGGMVVHSQSGQIVASTQRPVNRPISEAQLAWESGIVL